MLNIKPILALALAVLLPAAACAQEVIKVPKTYLSIDYTQHPTFGQAVRNSFAPTDFKANVGAVARNTIEPLNPVRYVGSIVAIELQKQIASGEGISVKKVVSKLDPASIAGGYAGAQLGEMVGAVAQTALARAVGPVGGTLGFALRPVLWLAGSSIGSQVGRGIAKGEPGNPLKHGIATALRELNPVLDAAQMIGDNVGGVIGQALIPIPFVGMMVGASVGGLTGLMFGKAVTATGPGKALDESLRASLNSKADSLAPREARSETDVLVPTITGPGKDPKKSVIRDPEPKLGFAPKADGEPVRDPEPKHDPKPITDPAAKKEAIAQAYKELQDAIQKAEPQLIDQKLKEYEAIRDGGKVINE